ncbi:hypothetical protein WG66_002918 [Moniliophthora roreri]|nr:hypothetical protein WG66_002918 [Moniliophthora roreri]
MIEAKLQTATIDDEYGDSVTGAKPTFLPGAGGFWQGSECDSSCGYPECQGCGLSIDPKRAYKGTWHVATHRVEDPTDLVQIEFIGTEVSAFCIVPDPQGNITTQYELTFLLDGIPAGGIWTGPDGTPVTETQYSVRCFHQSALDNKKHTLILRAESMRFDTVFLFDYATYVYDDEQTDDITPAGPSPTASPSESSTSTQIPSITNLSPPATSSSIPPPAVRPSSNMTNDSPSTTPSVGSNSPASGVTSHSSASTLSTLLPSPTSQQSSNKAPSRRLVITLAVVVATVVCLSTAIFTIVYRLRRGRARARSGIEPRRSDIDPYTLRGAGTIWQEEDNTLLEGGNPPAASARRTRRVKRKRRSAQVTSTQSQSAVGRPPAEEAPPPPYY